jgi:adenosylhomocysteine nucleosidase
LNGGCLGIVAALEAEARTLGPAMRRQDGLASLGDGALLVVSGMGGELAAVAAHRLAEAGVSALLSFGLAGGLDPALDAGRVVLPSEVISLGGARVATCAEWRGRMARTIADLEPVADKAMLFRETGAAAVDMESLAIARVAAVYDLPFLAVRVIVDGAAEALPRAVAAAGRSGRLRILPLIGGLAAAPWDIAGLIRLARGYRTATRSLAAVARGARIA